MLFQDGLYYLLLQWPLFLFRQLIAHLQVFSKFSNPRALYLESKLYELYLQVSQINSVCFDLSTLLTFSLPEQPEFSAVVDRAHL
jgi:hypothetical protein